MRIKLATLICLAALSGGVRADGEFQSEFIYETAPFAQCHASTLVETKAGLVAAWFGGEREGHASVGVWLSRHVEGKWTPPIEVANGDQPGAARLPCWNPVLFQPKEGPLMLFYKVGPSPQKWWCLLRTSNDAGKNWSEPTRLPEGYLGPIKSKPIQLANGDIVCPSSTESVERPSKWRVHFERTSDLGKTWSKSSPTYGEKVFDAIQPNLLNHGEGRLQAVGRTRVGKIFSVESKDAGKTWGEMTLLDLPNNNSGTDAGTLMDGRHVLVYNHTLIGRTPLNVAVSADGKTWKPLAILENTLGEYSYPAVIQTNDGKVHVVYTWKRQRIKHVVLDPK